MNYIRQINAFLEKRVGVLGAKEQAMYFSLLGIANQLRWPEWFTVSNAQLKREIMIKSTNTITETRNNLESNGFIQIIHSGNGKMLQYHLPMLYETSSKNEQVSEATSSKNEQVKNSTGSNFEQDQYKNCTGFSKTGSKNEHIINSINNKHISTTTSNRETQKKENPDFLEVVNSYQQEIRPMCSPMELEKLADDIEHFGKDAVLKAIERSVLRNKRSLGYIEAILRRWETDGYDEVGKEDANGSNGSSGPAGKNYRRRTPLNSLGHKENYDPEAEARKWANESANDWEPEPWH